MMNDRAICPDCSRAVAIDVDLICSDCTDEADCASCAAMCWRNFHPACQNAPVDWRGRALAAENELALLKENIAKTVADFPEVLRQHNARIAAWIEGVIEGLDEDDCCREFASNVILDLRLGTWESR